MTSTSSPKGDAGTGSAPSAARAKSRAKSRSNAGPNSKRGNRRSDKRTAARIAAVQALYQLSATNAAPDDVLDEFRLHRMSEAGPAATADKTLFMEVFRGACTERETLNELIESSISDDWALERMDRVLVALLNAGAWELLGRAETPARVVIAEYVDVARVFFDKREPAFVNGVLDKLARKLRAGEFDDADPQVADTVPDESADDGP